MHPFAAEGKRMSRRSAKYPCQRHERNEQRAVGNAGSYAVRHRRAEHGGGSGSYRRVPEPVIARHPRGARERQRGETYKRFDAEPFYTAVVIGQGKSKNRWFLAAFFSIFLSLLKEIWPPEAYMQDAGAARNRRTENGPSGTPAPTGCATEAARNDPRPGRGIPFLHLTTKAQKIATQGQLFPPRVIVFRQAASKRALTGCLLSAFVCVILGNDSTNRNLRR